MNIAIKNLILLISILGVAGAKAGSGPGMAPPAAPVATNTHGPRIQFSTSTYDFGRVRSGELVKHTYCFTNTGDASLLINSVNPQCGCTTAGAWTRQVEPGQAGSIPIQFNTMAYNGPVFKQVTVSCNATNQPLVFLQLKGTVFKPYEVIPPLAILNLPPDLESASTVLTITNHTDEPLILSTPTSNNHTFSAQLITNVLGKGYQLKLSTVPPLSAGSLQSQITLRTSWTNTPVIAVTAVANVQPALLVIPSYVTLAPGPLSNPITNSVAIQNNSTNPVTLSDPEVNVPGVGAQIRENQPGKTFTALLGFPRGFEVKPGQQVLLTLKTSNPKFPTLKVPVLQMPRPMPVFRPAPTITPVRVSPTPTPAPAAAVPPQVKQVSSNGPRPVPPRPPLPPRPPAASAPGL